MWLLLAEQFAPDAAHVQSAQSAKGMKRSLGLMVNYCYELKRLDRRRERLAKGRMPVSGDIESLLRG